MNRNIYIISFLLFVTTSLAQNKIEQIDSLSGEYNPAERDSNLVNTSALLTYHYFQLNIDSAIYYAKVAKEVADELKSERLMLVAKRAMGRAYSERDIPASMNFQYEALNLARKLNDQAAVASCYHSIGLLYLYAGSNDKYIDYLRKERSIYLELGEVWKARSCLAEIGGMYSYENPDSARYYLNLSGVDSSYWNSEYHQYYWGNTEKDSNPEKAKRHFLKSLEISKKKNNLRGYSLATRWLCIFLQEQDRIDSAIVVAKDGLEAAYELGFLRGIRNNSEQLYQIYDEQGQIDSAYKYLTINVNARDELLSQEKINQIQQTSIREQRRAQQLQAEKDQIQAEIRLYGASGAALFFLAFTIFFYRNQRRTKRSNQLLRKQSREINEKNTELEESYKNLKSTQSQLIQSEKMASLGELTAGIAHEIQNPLNFVNNFSEVSSELIDEVISDVAAVKTRFIGSPPSSASPRDIASPRSTASPESTEPPRSSASPDSTESPGASDSPGSDSPDTVPSPPSTPSPDDQDLLSETSATLADIKQNLEKITHHGKRADAIVKGMLAHSRSGKGEKAPTDINALAEEYLKLSYHGLRARDKSFNADFKTDFDPNLPKVDVVPQDIGRVLLNLINNAFQAVQTQHAASPQHAPSPQHLITVTTKNIGDKIEISVKDNGPGIPDSIKDKIFQPFFTTKPTGQGTGLGLSLSYDIVKAHGGELTVGSEPGSTEFQILIPLGKD